MVIESVKVRIQPLSACDLPYAQMLADKHPVFPEVDAGEGRVALEMRTLKHWAKAMRLEQMAIHFSYNQTYVALKGVMAVVVAPPPGNTGADISEYEFDYGAVSAFELQPGDAIFIDKGVWHHFLSLTPECRYLNVTRKNPGEGIGSDTAGRIDRIHEMRPYIEFVDLAKRDAKVIELEQRSA
jgi:ureidoglycolate hydrolase